MTSKKEITKQKKINNSKTRNLAKHKEKWLDQFLATIQVSRINNYQSSTGVDERGAMQDILLNISEVFDYKLEPMNNSFA